MKTIELNQSIAVIRDVLAKEFHPSAIFLFGSHAWGTPDAQSDIDICVILKHSELSQADRIRQGLRALLSYHFNLDLLVFTEAEFAPRIAHPSTLAHQIAYKGIKLYEAA